MPFPDDPAKPHRRRALASIAAGMAALASDGPAQALEPRHTGVVLMHGEWFNGRDMRPVAEALRAAGFSVETPEMPWSGLRLYDRSSLEVHGEIDAAAARLAALGARRIVVGGHGSGAAAALRYAALGRPLAALVLIAPAPVIESKSFQDRIAGDMALAHEMLANNEGDTPTFFHDVDSQGESRRITTTPNIYLSYNDPDGPAAMTRAAPRVGSAPILWVAAVEDPALEAFKAVVLPKLPLVTRLERVDIVAGPGAVAPAAAPVRDWLLSLG